MKIHVLPGIDPKTEQWANSLIQELRIDRSTATVQRYLHWQSDTGHVNREKEIERLKRCTMDLLIGKSLGVGLGLRAIIQGIIKPEKAVFIGVPLTSLIQQGHDLQSMVDAADVTSLYIQQTDDPLGSARSLGKTLPDSQIIEVPGSDHQYADINTVVTHILKWLEGK